MLQEDDEFHGIKGYAPGEKKDKDPTKAWDTTNVSATMAGTMMAKEATDRATTKIAPLKEPCNKERGEN